MLGPTASGKSGIAMHLAQRLSAEILSVDSMQVYRGMDVGTAKPSAAEQAEVRHFMIDVADPGADYTVAEFQSEARQATAGKKRPLVIVGGSGLHFRSYVDPLEFPQSDAIVRAAVDALSADAALAELFAADPTVAEHVDLANPRRVQRAVEILRLGGATPTERATSESAVAARAYASCVPFTAIGVDPAEGLEKRVAIRFDSMVESGLLEEVAALDGRLGRNASQAVGYKELLPVVRDGQPLAEGRQQAIRATMALAKRQRTFFRRDPRITWMPWRSRADERFADAWAELERTVPWIS